MLHVLQKIYAFILCVRCLSMVRIPSVDDIFNKHAGLNVPAMQPLLHGVGQHHALAWLKRSHQA